MEIDAQARMLYEAGVEDPSKHSPLSKEDILHFLKHSIQICAGVNGALREINHRQQAVYIMENVIRVIMKNLPSPGTRYGLILATKLTSQNTQKQLDNKSLVTGDQPQKVKNHCFTCYSDLYQLTDDPTLYLYTTALPETCKHPKNKDIYIGHFMYKKEVFEFNFKKKYYKNFYATGNNKKHIANFCGPRIMFFNIIRLFYMQTQGRKLNDPLLKRDLKVEVILKFMCLSNSHLVCFNRAGMQKNKYLSNFSTVSFESTASALSTVNDEIQLVDDIPTSLYLGNKLEAGNFELLDAK